MKIYYLGKRIREANGRFSSITKNLKWFAKRVTYGVGVMFIFMGLAVYVGMRNPVVKAELVKEFPPILTKIAKCESPTGHWKNGQVVVGVNKNGSYDTGKYQINSIWNKKATELGFNLAVEQDNEAMAEWIYANRGTGDWSSSANCWRK